MGGREVMVEYVDRDEDGEFWLDIIVERRPYATIGFETESERLAAREDMLDMMRTAGAKDVPTAMQ